MLLTEIYKIHIATRNLQSMHTLIEAQQKKTTTYQDPTISDLDDILRTHHNNPITPSYSHTPAIKKMAGKQRTKVDTSNIKMDPKSAEFNMALSNSDLKDTKRSDRADFHSGTDHIPPSKSLTTRNTDVSIELNDPNWHKIEDLPGYMKQAVRAIGRQVFSPLTSTDLEDIDIIANVNGSGPNSDEELRAVGSYLRKYGSRQTEAEIDFNQTVLAGYKADIQIWIADDTEYLTVKDHAGQYIYSWPASDSKHFNLFKTSVPRIS